MGAYKELEPRTKGFQRGLLLSLKKVKSKKKN
jgi:hypothetical protein